MVMSVDFIISWINIGAQIAQETHIYIVILVIKTIWNLKVDQKLVTPTLKKKQFVVMNCGCRMLLLCLSSGPVSVQNPVTQSRTQLSQSRTETGPELR